MSATPPHWGAAHAGVAAGVMQAVAEGTVPEGEAAALLLIAAVWVNPLASDERHVFENNKAATLGALRAGRAGQPTVADASAARHFPHKADHRP